MKRKIAESKLTQGTNKSLTTIVPAAVRHWMELSAGHKLTWFVNYGDRITVEVVKDANK